MAIQRADHGVLERLIEFQCAFVGVERLAEEGEGELCWSRTAIAPGKTSRAMVAQIKARIEGMCCAGLVDDMNMEVLGVAAIGKILVGRRRGFATGVASGGSSTVKTTVSPSTW